MSPQVSLPLSLSLSLSLPLSPSPPSLLLPHRHHVVVLKLTQASRTALQLPVGSFSVSAIGFSLQFSPSLSLIVPHIQSFSKFQG